MITVVPSLRKLVFITIYALLLTTTSSFAQEIVWEKSYGGIRSEYLFDAQPTADYGFILAGSSLSGKSGSKTGENAGDLDYWVWKMDEKGDLDWQKNFGGSGADLLQSIQNTIDGGFILAGTSNSRVGNDKMDDSRGQEDFWIIKLNAKGDQEWQKTLGGTGSDILKLIRQTKDGGYIVGGSSESSASGDKSEKSYGSLDFWVIKLDATGNVEWEKAYGGRYRDQLETLLPTKDEGYLVGGWSNSMTSGNKTQNTQGEGDYWMLKLNRNGEISWQYTLGGDQDDHLKSIIATKDGGYLIGGQSRSGITGTKKESNGNGTDFWIMKLSENGTVDWEKTYDFGEMDVLTTLWENPDGSVLIGGHAKTETTKKNRTDKKGINDYIALKITADGEEKWRSVIGGNGEDILQKLIITRDGGYVMAGTSNSTASRDKNSYKGLRDFWVVKIGDKEKKEEDRINGLEAFPNPTEAFSNIIVNHEFEKGTVTIYDLIGKQLQHYPVTTRTIPVDLQSLPVGIYIVNVETDVATDAIKIIKSN